MKYLATCPECEQRLPRSWVWKTEPMIRPCPGCKTPLRQNATWLRSGNALVALALSMFLGIGILLGAFMSNAAGGVLLGVFLGFLGWFGLGYFVFPYVSPYEIVTPNCRQCNYNLTGNTSGVCPECGEEI